MLILPEFQRPYLLESTNAPIVAKYYWSFSATMLDYTLSPFSYLEETIGPVINLEIDGFEFQVPYGWYILVSDPDTLELDCMSIEDCMTVMSYALTMTPVEGKFRVIPIRTNGIIEEPVSLVHPMMQKATALCHPIAEIDIISFGKTIQSVVIGPHDLFKNIAGKQYGDII